MAPVLFCLLLLGSNKNVQLLWKFVFITVREIQYNHFIVASTVPLETKKMACDKVMLLSRL